MISKAGKPKMRSAAAFQLRIVPSSFRLKIASLEDSTISASRARRPPRRGVFRPVGRGFDMRVVAMLKSRSC